VADLAERQPPVFSADLEGFDQADGTRFCLKVVSASDGRLLAEADPVWAEGEAADRRELLPVSEADLGETPWRLKWADDEPPRLVVNSRLRERDTFITRDAIIAGVAIPAAFHEVLFRLCLSRDAKETEWGWQWLAFAATYSADDPPDDPCSPESAQDWAEGVIDRFCAHHAFTSKINQFLDTSTRED
jgi:hypothetical protein